MDETFLTCLGFAVFALVLLPFLLVVSHARKIKALHGTMQKLNARVAILETRGTAAFPATPEAAIAPVVPEPAAVVPKSPQVPVAPALASILGHRVEPEAAASVAAEAPARKPKVARVAIDWEAFMGVKLFAWIGGFAL